MGVYRAKTSELFSDVLPELEAVEQELHRQLASETPLLAELGTHLLRGGGKRLRPALVLLSAKLFEYVPERLIPVAAAAELIHMATLIHDDIVDRAEMRRGMPTVNHKWGDDVSVLLGDYLFAKAFSMLAETGDNRIVRMMADVVFRMSGGELEQINRTFDLDRDIESYLVHIDKKTAYFIGECCRIGGLLGRASPVELDALRRYGFSLGMGFQIVDDILDVKGSTDELGKARGTDLQSGVMTLPILYALRHEVYGEELAALIKARRFDEASLERAIAILHETGALEQSQQTADSYLQMARDSLQELPDGQASARLSDVIDFVAHRRY